MKPFDPSIRAAAARGPKAAMPSASSRSTRPAQSGASGPTTTKSIASSRQNETSPSNSMGSSATHVASFSIPAFPARTRAHPAAATLRAASREHARARPNPRPEHSCASLRADSARRYGTRSGPRQPPFLSRFSCENGRCCRLTVDRRATRMRLLLADEAGRRASGRPLLCLVFESDSDGSAQAGGGEAGSFRLPRSTCTRRTAC